MDSLNSCKLLTHWPNWLKLAKKKNCTLLDIFYQKLEHRVGPYISILFDKDGRKIESVEHLNQALKSPSPDKNVYVIPADTHF